MRKFVSWNGCRSSLELQSEPYWQLLIFLVAYIQGVQYPSTEPVIPDAAQITRELAYCAGIYTKENTDSELTQTTEETQNQLSFPLVTLEPVPMLRQIWEAVQISNTNPNSGQIINGRTEYLRPVIQRMAHVDLLDDDRARGQGRWQLELSSPIFKALFFLEFFCIFIGGMRDNLSLLFNLTLRKGSYLDSEKLCEIFLLWFIDKLC